MSTPVKEYDVKAAMQVAGIMRPTPKDFALLDRFFMIHEGDVQKAGRALKLYLAKGSWDE